MLVKLLVTLLAVSSCYSDDDWRVFRGTVARQGQYPFAAHIGNSGCSASILNANTILTAGHCVCTPAVSVVVGNLNLDWNAHSGGPNTYPVSSTTLHPNYRNKCGVVDPYDIAVLKLSRPIAFNNNVQPITIDCTKLAVGTDILHIGYGLDENNRSGVLKSGTAKVYTYYGEQMISQSIPSHVLPGDSGGPVVRNYGGRFVQVAVNSGYANTNPPTSYYATVAAACAFVRDLS